VEVRPTMLGDLAAALKAIVSQRLLRTVVARVLPAVEVLLNTKLVSELIEKGDFSGVKEAMEKSMAEGSQTFEQDIARLIMEGVVDRKEGLAYADSPTNLMWRLQNDLPPRPASPPAEPSTWTTSRRSPKSCWTSKHPVMTDARTLHLAEQLISRPPSPLKDAGCLHLHRLSACNPWALSANVMDSGPARLSRAATCGQKGLQRICSKRKQLSKQ
jgi:hypothetical protein